jgi:hypothetical protein
VGRQGIWLKNSHFSGATRRNPKRKEKPCRAKRERKQARHCEDVSAAAIQAGGLSVCFIIPENRTAAWIAAALRASQ